MSKANVVQVIDTLSVGGAEQVLIDVTKILSNRGVDVDVLCLTNKGSKADALRGTCKVKSLNRKNKYSLIKMFQLKKELEPYKIIHCHFRHVYRYVKLVAIVFGVKGKIILHDHYGSIDIDKGIPLGFNKIFRVENYIGVSKTLVDWSAKLLKPDNILLLPNIIIKQNKLIRLKSSFDLVCVGNIKPVKNQLFAARLACKMQKSILFIGSIQDEHYYTLLKSYCESNDIDYVILTEVKNAQEYLSNATFAIHTAKSETGPLVLIEYMAHGIPFITYDTGEVAQLLKKLIPLSVIDNLDLKNWSLRFNDLVMDNDISKKLSSVFESNFSEDNYFNLLKNFYKKILNE
jgi:glycosyltransferase involved in cell wall biosynthesis